MKIMLNGESLVTQAKNLQELLNAQGYGDNKIAAALNGDFVPRSLYMQTLLFEGAQVEVVAPMQGG